MTSAGTGSSASRGWVPKSPLNSCWLVVAGRRHGPMPFDRAVERLHGFHAKGIELFDLTIIHARSPLGSKLERVPGREVGAELVMHAPHDAGRR